MVKWNDCFPRLKETESPANVSANNCLTFHPHQADTEQHGHPFGLLFLHDKCSLTKRKPFGSFELHVTVFLGRWSLLSCHGGSLVVIVTNCAFRRHGGDFRSGTAANSQYVKMQGFNLRKNIFAYPEA